MAGAAGTSGIRLEVDRRSIQRLDRALRILGEDRAAWMRDVWDDVGRHFAAAVRARAPGSIRDTVVYRGLNTATAATGVRARGVVKHPGSRSMEFGRVWYWRGYRRERGRYVGGAKRIHLPGQRPRPYLGVMSEPGNPQGATADVLDYARRRLREAIAAEWARIAGVE